MSDLTQIKTITGVASGFNDTVARAGINYISGTLSAKHTLSAGEGIEFYEDDVNNITRIDCTVTGGGGGGGTTVVSGIDNGLVYISAEDAGAIYGKPFNGTYNGFFSAINGATITDNTVSISCPEPTVITRIAGNSYDSVKYKTSPDGEWIGPVYQFDAVCEFVSDNGVVVIPISSNNYFGKAYFSAYEQLDVSNKVVIPPFIDTDNFAKFSDTNLSFGGTNTAANESLVVGTYNSAVGASFALGSYNSANANSVALGYNNSARYYSQSFGNRTSARDYSMAFGSWTSADYYSLAGGQQASSYYYSFALGNYASANSLSLAVGQFASARSESLCIGSYSKGDNRSLSIGYGSIASSNSLAMGAGSAISYSMAVGENTSAYNHSQAFGRYTSANNSGMAIGRYNNITTAAFVIGNGSGWNNHSDAFVIFHDGSVSAAGKISANGVELGSVPYNIVYTASLPDTPDANTLYLIPEA